MPLIIIISALIAASLTMRLKDSGRFYIFLSGLIIFMSYYGLSLSQEVFSNFSLNSTIVFFSIHGIYLIAAILLALDQSYQNFSFNLGGLKYSRNFMINLFVLFLIATVFSYLVFYVFLQSYFWGYFRQSFYKICLALSFSDGWDIFFVGQPICFSNILTPEPKARICEDLIDGSSCVENPRIEFPNLFLRWLK